MGRIPRNCLLYDGCFAHIISRSIDKRKIFENEQDFNFFKNLLSSGKKEYGFGLYHYCLMHTHFHLVVRVGGVESFSKGMHRIKWDYTREYNQRHKRRGPLWQNRFKSLLIENEKYLYACGLYIENNPNRASLVREAEEWEHSSSRHYANITKDPLIDNYETANLSLDADLKEDLDFERGFGIGSDWFKYKLKKLS